MKAEVFLKYVKSTKRTHQYEAVHLMDGKFTPAKFRIKISKELVELVDGKPPKELLLAISEV